jgi:hypothetical protein
VSRTEKGMYDETVCSYGYDGYFRELFMIS